MSHLKINFDPTEDKATLRFVARCLDVWSREEDPKQQKSVVIVLKGILSQDLH